MVRIEEDDDLRRIVEALLDELTARGTLEHSTADIIIEKGKRQRL
jgi:hypothetical protein